MPPAISAQISPHIPPKSHKYWLLVLAASVLEICWATLLKAADSLGLWVLTLALITVNFVLIYHANNHLPVGTVYATFTGIGAGGTVISGIILFGEVISVVKISLLCLLLVGVLGLKLFTDKKGSSSRENAKTSMGTE